MARVKMTTESAPPSFEASKGRRVAQVLATEEAREQLPRVSPYSDFLLQVHPMRWDVHGDRVIPIVSRFPLVPGVNGISSDRHGRPQVSSAIANRRDRGWTVIPPELYEDEEGIGYVQAIPVLGGFCHVTIWDSLFPGSTKIRCDLDAMADWLHELIDQKKIPAPSAPALEDLVERLERELSKHLNLQRRDAKYTALAEKSARRLETARAALEKYNHKAQPVKRGRRVKATTAKES